MAQRNYAEEARQRYLASQQAQAVSPEVLPQVDQDQPQKPRSRFNPLRWLRGATGLASRFSS